MNIRGLCIKKDEPMSAHCSFKTGGTADYFITPQSTDELACALQTLRAKKVPYTVIGRGTNLLVSDRGYRGAVIMLGDPFAKCTIQRTEVTAECGLSLAALVSFCVQRSLAGLEFAAGIPGSVGGGIAMNAGAYGGELGDFISCVTVLDREGRLHRLNAAEMDFSYRHSRVQDTGEIVVSAVFSLTEGERGQSLARIKELAERRREKQPLQYPSAGSTFKRPEGNFAGTLIEQCGLKGYTLGGAQVSEKHAGFIINTGGATSADIYGAIRHVQQTVEQQTGILLVPEVKMIGEF